MHEALGLDPSTTKRKINKIISFYCQVSFLELDEAYISEGGEIENKQLNISYVR
jgi:hypothetical protein